MDPHEYLRNDVRRIYALSGLIDEDEFNSIDTMSIRAMYKKALLWNNMSENLLTAARLKCKCGGYIHVPVGKTVYGDNNGSYYYPDFTTMKLKIQRYQASKINHSCGHTSEYNLYFLMPENDTSMSSSGSYQFSERLTKSQKTLKILKELVELEDSQSTPVMAQKLDELTEELSKKEIENRRLLKIIDAIKGNLN